MGHYRGYTTLMSSVASTNTGVSSDTLELGQATNAALFINNEHATRAVNVQVWVASAPRSAGRNVVAGLVDNDWYRLLGDAGSPITYAVAGDASVCINLQGLAPQFVKVVVLSNVADTPANVSVYGQAVET